MLVVAVLSVVLLCVPNIKSNCIYPDKAGNQADYYWRDYFGTIPKDAVSGGYTVDGNATYIGQSPDVKRVGIFPGTIYAGQKGVVTCPTVRFTDVTYVKILCSVSQSKFEWVETTIDTSPLLTDYHWVIGGSEFSIVWYIGRVNFEGEVQIGRVYDIKSSHKGLWICNKTGSQVNFHSFELLVLPR